MTYNEKRSLYESIMKEVAKTVKRKINEDFLPSDSDDDIFPEDEEFDDNVNDENDNDEQINSDITEFDDIHKITVNMFYNSKLNKSFYYHNDERILYNSNTNKIGCEVNIRMFSSNERKNVEIWASSFGELLESFYIVHKASYKERIFNITTNRIIEIFLRVFLNKCLQENKSQYLFNDKITDILEKDFDRRPPKTVESVLKAINKIKTIKTNIERHKEYNNCYDNDYYNEYGSFVGLMA